MNTYEVTLSNGDKHEVTADYYETAKPFVEFQVGDPVDGVDTVASFQG